MWCGVVTLFPEMFQALTRFGITQRAIQHGLLEVACWNPRDFAQDRHKTVDDRPYGGGPGMVMSVYPLRTAIQAARAKAPGPVKTIYVSPQGKPLQQQEVDQLSKQSSLLFVAGRYEGVDERLIQLEVDEEWSLGDYVLTGGELAVMVMIDAITRLLPGALGHEASSTMDSFSGGLLDFPHYTRPEVVDGLAVPSVLLGGDHRKIAIWRLKQQLGRTHLRRPDLLEKVKMDEESQKLLQEFLSDPKMQ